MNRWIGVLLLACVWMTAGCSGTKRLWSRVTGKPIVEDNLFADDIEDLPADEFPAADAAPAGGASNPFEGRELLAEPEVVEATALTINGEILTVGDVFLPIRQDLTRLGESASREAFIQDAGKLIGGEIQRQIGEILAYAKAAAALNEKELAYIDRQVDEQLRDMIVAAGGSRRKLERQLAREGGDLDRALKAMRRQRITRHYLYRMFVPRLGATRDEMWRYYQEHLDEYTTEPKVKMQILAFPFEAFTPDGARFATDEELADAKKMAVAAASDALARLRAGDDFTRVVREESVSTAFRADRGGVWDMLPLGSFKESDVEHAAFDQEVGEISDVIVADSGAFIVKTLDRQAGDATSFADAQREIDTALRNREYRRLTSEYYRDLQRKAVITQAEAFEQVVLDRALALYFEGDGEQP